MTTWGQTTSRTGAAVSGDQQVRRLRNFAEGSPMSGIVAWGLNDQELLDRIRGDEALTDQLVRFDFDLRRASLACGEPVAFPDGEPFSVVAGDSSGGAFLLVGAPAEVRPVVYVSSEGQGGMIAGRLQDAVALVVGLPSIHDAMRISARADGVDVRDWLRACDAEIRADQPGLDERRAELVEALGLPDAYTLLAAMHAAMADKHYRPLNEEGVLYESMLFER